MERIISLLVNAAALYVATIIVPNLDYDFGIEGAIWKFLLIALIFGLVNTFVKPILRILTFPITMVTLGLFLLVINALMLMLTASLAKAFDLGFHVDGFWTALFGSIVISLASMVLESIFLRADRT